ncbi:MAG: alpha/beta hydrolase-fold protein [Bacteroidota bacterium]
MKIRISLIIFTIIPLQLIFGQGLSSIKRDTIYSEVLKEKRSYQLYLPPSYPNYTHSKKYPIVIVLDGDHLFQMAVANIDFYARTGKVPEAIVIGISNTRRTRDFTPTHSLVGYDGEEDQGLRESGGAKDFLRFLETELLDSLHHSYRTNNYQLLIGHSLAGLFGAYAYNQASSIDGYILIDPSLWWDDEQEVRHMASLDSSVLAHKMIFVSGSGNFGLSREMEHMRNGQEQFVLALKQHGLPHQHAKMKLYPDDNHGTVPLRSIIDGLEFIFDGYYIDEMKNRSAEEVIASCKRFETQMGKEFPGLEGMINWLGIRMVEAENIEEGIKLLEMNQENYPDSWKANFQLAKAYQKLGKHDEARKFMTLALDLNPENKAIKAELEKN